MNNSAIHCIKRDNSKIWNNRSKMKSRMNLVSKMLCPEFIGSVLYLYFYFEKICYDPTTTTLPHFDIKTVISNFANLRPEFVKILKN
jgi:hypothetical protein